VLGDVETFAFGLDIGAEPNDDVDDPVEVAELRPKVARRAAKQPCRVN
jgi:hypothetical protein